MSESVSIKYLNLNAGQISALNLGYFVDDDGCYTESCASVDEARERLSAFCRKLHGACPGERITLEYVIEKIIEQGSVNPADF